MDPVTDVPTPMALVEEALDVRGLETDSAAEDGGSSLLVAAGVALLVGDLLEVLPKSGGI